MSLGTPVELNRARDWRYAAKIVGSSDTNLAGDCSSPYIRSMRGLSDPTLVCLGIEKEAVQLADIEVRCRKCPNCRQAHRRHWAMRAQAEIREASRTWFATLTLTPERQFYCVASATERLWLGGTRYRDLDPDDAFKERSKPLVEEFQRFMKRVRKDHSGVRHLTIVERHKSGAPHMHMLLHERGPPVRHAALTERWRWGFSKWNLVAEDEKPHAANYVTKYLTKSLTLRVIASGKYGNTTI